jgi:hypothetical protein
MDQETITIPRSEYEDLIEQSQWLYCLEAAGVDNWTNYGHAYEIYEEEFLND